MDKPQGYGVETLSLQARQRLPIKGVTQNRASEIGQMDPNLMGSSRFQPAAQMGMP